MRKAETQTVDTLHAILKELRAESATTTAFEATTTGTLSSFMSVSSANGILPAMDSWFDTLNSSMVAMIRLSSSNLEISAKGLETSNDLLDFFRGNDMQQAEDRKEFLEVLKGLRSATGASPNSVVSGSTAPADGGGMFGSGFFSKLLPFLGLGALVGLAGLVTSFIVTVTKEFGAAFKFISRALGFAKEDSFIGKMLTKIKAFFSEDSFIGKMLTKIKAFFSEESVFGKMLGGLVKGLRGIGSSILKLFRALEGIGFAALFGRLEFMFIKISPIIKGFWNLGGSIGKLLGKLAIPLMVVMALWDTVTGAIEGYKTDGVVGMFRGGLIGLVNSLVGWIFDIPKDIISWMFEKLGFEEISKTLDEISFKGIITSIYDWVAGIVTSIGEWLGKVSVEGLDYSSIWKSVKDTFMWIWDSVVDSIKSAATSLASAAGGLFGDLSGAVDEMYKSLLRAILPVYDSSLGPAGSLGNIIATMLDGLGVYDQIKAPTIPEASKSGHTSSFYKLPPENLRNLSPFVTPGGATQTSMNVAHDGRVSVGPTVVNNNFITYGAGGSSSSYYGGR